jgi:hypothetical protein
MAFQTLTHQQRPNVLLEKGDSFGGRLWFFFRWGVTRFLILLKESFEIPFAKWAFEFVCGILLIHRGLSVTQGTKDKKQTGKTKPSSHKKCLRRAS